MRRNVLSATKPVGLDIEADTRLERSRENAPFHLTEPDYNDDWIIDISHRILHIIDVINPTTRIPTMYNPRHTLSGHAMETYFVTYYYYMTIAALYREATKKGKGSLRVAAYDLNILLNNSRAEDVRPIMENLYEFASRVKKCFEGDQPDDFIRCAVTGEYLPKFEVQAPQALLTSGTNILRCFSLGDDAEGLMEGYLTSMLGKLKPEMSDLFVSVYYNEDTELREVYIPELYDLHPKMSAEEGPSFKFVYYDLKTEGVRL